MILEIKTYQLEDFTYQKSFNLTYQSSNKFYDDKLNFESDDYYLLLDGVILNKNQLLDKTKFANWKECLLDLYRKKGKHFFKKLKGSYFGFLFDKKKNFWILFTDHISSKPLYFVECKNQIIFSNNYYSLVEYYKKLVGSVTLNNQAAYLLLSYGFVFEDITITNEIKRLMIGNCGLIYNNKLVLENFYNLTNIPVEISEDEAIDEIDKHFKNSLKLAFDKDREYGYTHVASLSGGLDSRMVTWVAHELGYVDQLNLTFSQSNYLDETVPNKITAELKHQWLFKSLDNGDFLRNIDAVTKITGGNVLYYGLAHGLSMYQFIDFDKLGLLHTGQLGDVVLGTFFSNVEAKKQFSVGDGAYSNNNFLGKLNINLKGKYENEEIFKMYIRGFYGANQGLLGIMNYTETFSPFYDIDFMEFSLSIPVRFRFDHYIYKKWILNKYPKAARYIWEKEGVPVDYSYWIKIFNKKIAFNQIPNKISQKIGFSKSGFYSKNNMNPIDYWLNNNTNLKTFFNDYFINNIDLLIDNDILKNDCFYIFRNGSGTEQVQVLSLLSSLKQLG